MRQTPTRSIRAPANVAARVSVLQLGACLGLCLGWTCFALAQSPSSPAGPRLNAPDTPDVLPAPRTPAASQPGKRPIVIDVRFVGNNHTKETVVFNSIHTRKNLEFDSEVVQKDVRTLMATRRFRNVIPHVKETKEGVVVTYELIEHPFIAYIEHIGNRGLSEKKLSKEHGLKKGDPLSSFSVQEGRRKIEDLYHHSGFPKATVTIQEGDKPKDKGVIYAINEGPIQRVAHVEFIGNAVATDSRLETLIQSKPGKLSYATYYFANKFDRQKLEQDLDTLTKYYRSLGYFSARIGRELVADDSGEKLTIHFIIDEGPRYKIRNLSIEGSTKFEPDKLVTFLKLKKGDYYTQEFMDRDRTLLTDVYGTQGHAFADIQADVRLLEEPGELDLVYRVTEGAVFHVGEIRVHIAGDFPHTKETVILNRANIRHGDLVDAREIRNWERRLKASQLFITSPQDGEPPRIEIKEPTNSALGLDSPPRRSTVRGQSPEDEADPAERLAADERQYEARYGKSIYSRYGSRQVEATRPAPGNSQR